MYKHIFEISWVPWCMDWRSVKPSTLKLDKLQIYKEKINKLWTKKTKTIDEFETYVKNVKNIKVYMVINPTNM